MAEVEKQNETPEEVETEEVDVEGLGGRGLDLVDLAAQRRGVELGRAERAQAAGLGDGGDQRRRRDRGHRRLDDRQFQSQALGQDGPQSHRTHPFLRGAASRRHADSSRSIRSR